VACRSHQQLRPPAGLRRDDPGDESRDLGGIRDAVPPIDTAFSFPASAFRRTVTR